MDNSIDPSTFSVEDYPLLMRIDFFTYVLVLAGYIKDGLPFVRELSLERSEYYYFRFRVTIFNSVCVDNRLCLCARFLMLFDLL